jgi:hypothetical protein
MGSAKKIIKLCEDTDSGSALSLTGEEAELLKLFYDEGLMYYKAGRDTVHRDFLANLKTDKDKQAAMKSLASKMSKL